MGFRESRTKRMLWPFVTKGVLWRTSALENGGLIEDLGGSEAGRGVGVVLVMSYGRA
jgi:hypothetical protein